MSKNIKRRPIDLIYTCTNPDCADKVSSEAYAEVQDDQVLVKCRLCGKSHRHPKESLNRESIALVEENLRGHFVVTKRSDHK